MKDKSARIFRYLGPLLGLALFGVALLVLYHELRHYGPRAIIRDLKDLPDRALIEALALTTLSYLVMTGYDGLSLRYIKRRLSYSKIALASFIGYAFSNNIGLSMVAGATVRYRLYSAWDLSAEEITKVILFGTLTLWLGFLAVGGLVFCYDPVALPFDWGLHLHSARVLGLIFLALVGGYILLCWRRRRKVAIRDWEFELPALSLTLPQLMLASLDWLLAGGVLFVLLPGGISLTTFMGIFLLAQMAGLASQIPGGIGVFEAAMLMLLGHYLPPAVIIGALLAYRAIYYILPLLLAAVLLGFNEARHRRELLRQGARAVTHWIPQVMPPFMALTIFVGGSILLVSGELPGEAARLEWVGGLVSLPVIEISHFLGSLAGVALLLLARGLQRRLDAAYVMTCALLALGAVLALLRGVRWEAAFALICMLVALLPCRWCFYRKAKLTSETFTPGWIAAIGLVVIMSVWLGVFSHKHVEYTSDLWWRFALQAQAPRALRALVGGIVMLLAFSISRLLHPAAPEPAEPQAADLERARPVIGASSEAYANLALLKDKQLLFSASGASFLMYAVSGQSWVVMGDPVGPRAEWPELVWSFGELCERHAGWPVFYEVASSSLSLYVDAGMTLLKLGEEARVDLTQFSLEGSGRRKDLRYICRRLEREGCSFEVVPPEQVGAIMPELRRVSDAWLAERRTSEKGFSLGFFDPEYLAHFAQAVVRREGRIIAFANVWQSGERYELSVDLMRHVADAPGGVMDFLFVKTMLWGKEQGYGWFNLGMAPLSGLETHALAPLWNKVGGYIFGHAEQFYNFQGLRQFKEKFEPQWQPRYLASPAALLLPRILVNIAALSSGGLKNIVLK